MKSTLAIVATAVLATTTSAHQLSHKQKTALTKELDAWRQSQAGKAAEAHGLLPPESRLESTSPQEKLELELTRFAHTKSIVANLNKQHNGSAVFSTNNMFALMSDAEFKSYVQGSFGKPQKKRQLRGDHVAAQLAPAQVEANGVDWTTNKCMPPVKNQGSCGSCWSFAAVGASAMAHCLVSGSLIDLSEQQLVSCASSAGQGCQGGWPNKALEYIAQTGVCSSAEFPYTESDSQCMQSCKKNKLSIGQPVDIQGESALQSALDKQPVTVVVEAGNDVWRNYQSGVVTQCPGGQSDHAVIAVGYGSKDGSQHFKIRNSWGTGWGEQGYMYLQRGVGGQGMCNVAEAPSYPSMSGAPHPNDDDPDQGPTSEPDMPTDMPDDNQDWDDNTMPDDNQDWKDDQDWNDNHDWDQDNGDDFWGQ